MGFPYIIWTMQRSGGTTFAALLAAFSEFRSVQHEPFNPERRFGNITRTWQQNQDSDGLESAVSEVLLKRPTVKHCYELVPFEVSCALMRAAQDRGYRHILLKRQPEIDRVLSLQLAKLTGAWGKSAAEDVYRAIKARQLQLDPIDIGAAKQQMIHCRSCSAQLAEQFQRVGIEPCIVNFDSLFNDPSKGLKEVMRVLEYLGGSLEPGGLKDNNVTRMLRDQGQNSAEILPYIPNINEASVALEALA